MSIVGNAPKGFEDLGEQFDLAQDPKSRRWLIGCRTCNQCWTHPDKPASPATRLALVDHAGRHDIAEGRAG